MGESITIGRGQLAMITSVIAILYFSWAIVADYNGRGNRIERLEYQAEQARAQRREMSTKFDSVKEALQEQAIEFVKLRSVIKEGPVK